MGGTISVKSTLGEGSEFTVELELESAERAYQTLPILAMSANANDEDVKACLAAGMNAHISKPFTPEGLRKTLDEQILK